MPKQINILGFRIVYILVLFGIAFSGCTKASQLTDAEMRIVAKVKTENPNCTCEPYLNKYTKGNSIFYVLQYKGPACTTIPSLFDAEGNQIINIASSFPDFFKDAILLKQVWSCQ